tara:strand:- start:302 stop:493 length:192 start_codon:yes stop_codon:yes gene_type:complete
MHLQLQERANKLLQERNSLINRVSEINGALSELESLAKSLGEDHKEQHEEIEVESEDVGDTPT